MDDNLARDRFVASHVRRDDGSMYNIVYRNCNKELASHHLRSTCENYLIPLQMDEMRDRQLLGSVTKSMSVFGDLDDVVLTQAEQMLLSCVKMSTDVVKLPKRSQSHAYPELRSTFDPVCDPRLVQHDLHGMMGMPIQASDTVADTNINGEFLAACIDTMRGWNPVIASLYTQYELQRFLDGGVPFNLGGSSKDQLEMAMPTVPIRVVEKILRQGRGAFEFEADVQSYRDAPFGYLMSADDVQVAENLYTPQSVSSSYTLYF